MIPDWLFAHTTAQARIALFLAAVGIGVSGFAFGEDFAVIPGVAGGLLLAVCLYGSLERPRRWFLISGPVASGWIVWTIWPAALPVIALATFLPIATAFVAAVLADDEKGVLQ